jgi:predicted ATPase/class 3 adenylate cyclase/DNA-binding winged helix-turn-helix (wHTH) protein
MRLRIEPLVFNLLAYLVQHPGHTITKDVLCTELWPDQPSVSDGSLTNCVAQARKVLGDTGQDQKYIQTVYGRGYRFIASVAIRQQTEMDAPNPPAEALPILTEQHGLNQADGGVPPPAVTSPPPPALPSAPDPVNAPQAISLIIPEAERRQLTVLFCDLADSTRLAGRLDPEDFREIVLAYQAICVEVLQRFDGHVAQYLSDGLLVYFGYPQAHEDDAQRAVRAGLGIFDAMGALNTRLEREKGIRLAVRIGIHTGPVVVGPIGSGSRHEQLALGETPHLAARLQSLVAPNMVAISATTHRLVQGYFHCDDLGSPTLKGVETPLRVYRVVAESAAQSRLDVATGLTPLVGREHEVGLLRECWAQSRDWLGQVVLLSGEAGIGKSRLIQVLKEHMAGDAHTRVECRGSSYYQQSAFYPVVEHVQRLLQFRKNDTPEAKLHKLEALLVLYGFALEEVVPLFTGLLSLPLVERYAPLALTPERQKQKTLEVLLTWLLREAERQPVCLIMEDLHWVDPSTLEWLSLLIDQIPLKRVFMLLTFRPDFQPPWAVRSHLTHVRLGRLSPRQTEEMIGQVVGDKALPVEVIQKVVATTDGVPLFVEELTKMVVELGLVMVRDGRYELTRPLSSLAIPATLHDSLMARLDRLGSAKQVAQLGAVVGREFAYEVLQAVAPMEEAILQQGLAQLTNAELLYQRGMLPQTRYIFKHALIQDAAYQSLLKSTRQQYHQRIAQAIIARFPEVAETQPELLAQHYTEAGLSVQAMPYWQHAGERALQRSAYVEAIAHLTTGLTVLQTLPQTPARTQQELMLHVALGGALVAVQGYATPEVARVYTRARELCRQLGDTPQLFPVLRGLFVFYLSYGQLQTAQNLAEHLLRQAERQAEVAPQILGHYLLGLALFCRGTPVEAVRHFEQAIAAYDFERHRQLVHVYGIDLGVVARGWMALSLWLLGYPDQALVQSQEAWTLAQELAHPYSLAAAQILLAWLHQFRQEAQAAYDRAVDSTALATQQGFPLFVAWGTVPQGWALTRQEQWAAGTATMREGLEAAIATGSEVFHPYFLALLAEAYGTAGQPEAGLRLLGEAQDVVVRTGERFYEAELDRLTGVLQLAQAPAAQAEAEHHMRHALDIARHQQAKSLELRVATSLSHLWKQQGKRVEARELLASIYGWFTEGFDTTDLQQAKALLAALV